VRPAGREPAKTFQFNGVTDHPAEPFGKFLDRPFGFIATRRPARLVIDMRCIP